MSVFKFALELMGLLCGFFLPVFVLAFGYASLEAANWADENPMLFTAAALSVPITLAALVLARLLLDPLRKNNPVRWFALPFVYWGWTGLLTQFTAFTCTLGAMALFGFGDAGLVASFLAALVLGPLLVFACLRVERRHVRAFEQRHNFKFFPHE